MTERPLSPPLVAMDLRAELLKSIWYAFTALDVEKSGKVSKSQLKVSNWGSWGGLGKAVGFRGCSASPWGPGEVQC